VTATGTPTEVGIDLSGGPFAPGVTPETDGGTSEIEFQVNLPSGTPIVRITGSTGDDHVVVGSAGINLNATEAVADVDVTIVGTPAIFLQGGDGADVLSVVGGTAEGSPVAGVSLRGDAGDDLLFAGLGPSSLEGGDGTDPLDYSAVTQLGRADLGGGATFAMLENAIVKFDKDFRRVGNKAFKQLGSIAADGTHVFASDGRGNEREFVVLGILEQSLQFTQGLFVNQTSVLETYDPVTIRTAYFFQLASGVDGDAVRAELEEAFFPYGLITLDIREEIATQFEASDRVLLLMQAYLALGLVVGITGLGVITIRAVVERRQEIGAMRALGFTRRMVRNVFLLEIALIAILGIVIGMSLGVLLAQRVWEVYFADIAVFVVPFVHLAAVALIAFAATLLATASPALRASRLPPAEALRYIE